MSALAAMNARPTTDREQGNKEFVTEIVTETGAFSGLQEEWNQLLWASHADNFFLTWEWLFTWWKHLGGQRKLFLVLARSRGQLMGIAPLSLSPPRLSRFQLFPALEFLGTANAGSDYLDVIVRPGSEVAVLGAFAPALAGGDTTILFSQLLLAKCAAGDLANVLKQRGWGMTVERTNTCPYVPLNGRNWKSYLAELGSEHRYNFNRRLRQLNGKWSVRFDQARTETERQEAMSILFQLHNLRWKSRENGSNAFCHSALVSFHQEVSRLALDRGWLRVYVLRLNGRPVAAIYGFRYNKKFYYYQTGFDPAYSKHSVGLVCMGLAIRAAIEEGVTEYDMLHGDEGYKKHWSRQSREIGAVRMYPPGSRGWADFSASAAVRRSKRMAHYVLPRFVLQGIKNRLNSVGV